MSNEQQLKEVIEGNKLIAEFFMVMKVEDETFSFIEPIPMFINTPELFGKWYKSEDLSFNRSFDWLIPVIEKINSICDKNQYRLSNTSKEQEFLENKLDNPLCWQSWSYHRVSLTIKIEQVYKSVIQFVQWYNTQSK